MSDCSSSAMETRTCGTCKNVRYTWLNCFHAANDERYYMHCTRPDIRACEHYVDDPDSLQRRYERLAQVAMQMHSTLGDALEVLSMVRVPRQNNKTSFNLHTLKCAERYISFHDELEELGVKLDGD